MSKIIETDLKTFIKFWLVPLGIVAAIFLIFKASTGIVIIGLSVFLALALRPLVRMVDSFFAKCFGRNKEHKTLSAVFAYLIVVLVMGAIFAVIGPVVVNETAKFVNNFPTTFEETFGGWEGINNIGKSIGIDNLQSELSESVTNVSSGLLGILSTNIISSIGGVANAIMKVILVLILTLLFLLDGSKIVDKIYKGVDAKKEHPKTTAAIRNTIAKMANVASIYVSRQIVAALLDGCASSIIVLVLSLIFGFDPSLSIPMGMITMIFYLIPMFGQFIGGTIVTILLLFSNPVAALAFAIVYIIYTQLENNIIVPKIQGDAYRLMPVTILCAIVIGMYMLGLIGAIIAIPIAGCIRILIDEYPKIKLAKEQDGTVRQK
jgi:predicted PurR-regulated permease PerM